MWYVYIVEGKDTSLYTGITTDLTRRLHEHNFDNIKGAKYLRPKRPVSLIFWERHNSQSEARIREAQIKKWKREYKLKLIEKCKHKSLPFKLTP